MKITDVTTFRVPPRWLFVRIRTDDGPTGWGEATLEGSVPAVEAAVAAAAPALVGADPTSIEAHWQRLAKGTFYRGGPVFGSAVAGIDQALWDLTGKALNVPVHRLFGGPVRERVRMYSWIGGDRPDQVAEQAAAMREAGFTAVKLNASAQTAAIDTSATVDEIVGRAASVRDAIGDDADFALDFHGRISSGFARRVIAELEPLRPLFVEEPVLPEHAALRLPDLTAGTTTPVACGERSYTRADFLPLLTAGIAVAQPDVSHCFGLSEARRIASLADTFDVPIAPHCPLGPIALAACLQLDFATGNLLIQEQSGGIHYNTDADLLDYLLDRSVFDFVDGHCELPTGSGLGIDVDERAVQRAAAAADGHDWTTPTWTHADGSFAEW